MPKRTKWAIAGAVAVFIALVVTLTLLYVNVWSAPTKQDFERARSDVSTLEAQYNELTIRLQLYGSSVNIAKPDGNKGAKTSYAKAVKAIDSSFKKLDDSKAMQNADINAAYDNLVKKQEEIRSYTDGFVLYRMALIKCVDVFDVTHGSTDAKKIAAAHKKAAAGCLPLLEQMEHSKTPYFADFAKSYASAIRKRQAVFDSYAAKKISQSEVDSRISKIFETDLRTVIGHDDGFAKAQQNASAYGTLQQLKKIIDQKIKQS